MDIFRSLLATLLALILSVVSIVVHVSGIGRGLVVQSGDWSARRTGVGRGERDLSVGASGIQRGYSGG